IIEELMHNAVLTKKRVASNTVLIGLRRFGKTAVLQRVYNKLFLEQDAVVPIYIDLENIAHDSEIEFAKEYFQRFVTHYIAFRKKDPNLAKIEDLPLEVALEYAKELGEKELIEEIERFMDYIKRNHYSGILMGALTVAKDIADLRNDSICIILDEFQEIIEILNHRTGKRMDLRGKFRAGAESRRATFIVSGSAVSLITRKVLGSGPLLGRFSPVYLEGLKERDAVELCNIWSKFLEIVVPEELAVYLGRRTSGCPYYIKTFLKRAEKLLKAESKKELTKEILSKAIAYELTSGEIWHELEEQLKKYFELNEWNITRAILYHSTELLGEFDIIDVDAVVKTVNRDKEEVYAILSKLARADLISDDGGVFRKVKDPILVEYLRIQYQLEIEGWKERKNDFIRNEINNLKRELGKTKGYLLEYKTREFLRRAGGHKVAGKFFNIPDKEIMIPVFEEVYTLEFMAPMKRKYQIDATGFYKLENEETARWVVEVKHHEKPIKKEYVKKFEDGSKALYEQIKIPITHQWFVSYSGFTEDALEELKKCNIMYTIGDQIKELFKLFGVY
ncbi:MAG: ATP-binding protein, partial [Methanosarcinales archaeon]